MSYLRRRDQHQNSSHRPALGKSSLGWASPSQHQNSSQCWLVLKRVFGRHIRGDGPLYPLTQLLLHRNCEGPVRQAAGRTAQDSHCHAKPLRGRCFCPFGPALGLRSKHFKGRIWFGVVKRDLADQRTLDYRLRPSRLAIVPSLTERTT